MNNIVKKIIPLSLLFCTSIIVVQLTISKQFYIYAKWRYDLKKMRKELPQDFFESKVRIHNLTKGIKKLYDFTKIPNLFFQKNKTELQYIIIEVIPGISTINKTKPYIILQYSLYQKSSDNLIWEFSHNFDFKENAVLLFIKYYII